MSGRASWLSPSARHCKVFTSLLQGDSKDTPVPPFPTSYALGVRNLKTNASGNYLDEMSGVTCTRTVRALDKKAIGLHIRHLQWTIFVTPEM